ncbi:hypothetical protein COU58_00140 [Candidatus Pacearchaeota archaeon CG10_big_fil_rev_8_21_14_0_10_32_42]|nr:MAG: hypothetical protein COU58_00140 [Candidatus Pacearchaeota archaeon CG10_big_fil_rev_8_21_14_0_10_32_42]
MKNETYGNTGSPIYTYSERPIEEKSGLLKKVLKVGIPLLVAGASIIYGSNGESEKMSLKYQGYADINDGTRILFFGSDEDRKNFIRIEGDIRNVRDFEVNKDYEVTIKKSNFGFLFPDKVVSMEKDKTD